MDEGRRTEGTAVGLNSGLNINQGASENADEQRRVAYRRKREKEREMEGMAGDGKRKRVRCPRW